MSVWGKAMSTRSAEARAAAGFTLIELVIAMVVVAILAAIAIPSYQAEVRKSHRTDAKTTLLDLAAREQRFYSAQNSFTASFVNLGYATAGNPASIASPAGYYTITVNAPAPAAGANPTFTITATATGTQAQDTACNSFTVDNTGQQLSYDSSSNPSTSCW